jgi:AraC-like DNA-binding protein
VEEPRHRSAALEPAPTLEAYLAHPVGRCVIGPTYAVWWLDASLNGIVFWGSPEAEHVRQVTVALEADLSPEVRPHASLIDARKVRTVDLGAFNVLATYVHRNEDAFERVVIRQAVLRPDGLAGAAVAGFHTVLASRYPVAVFTEPSAALRWLQVEHELEALERVDALCAAASAMPDIVVALRGYLDEHLGRATLRDAARALGMSTRQLQRKLSDARTRFRQEEADAKIRAAKILLLETNYDVKRVAIEVGCASLQHFGALFRKGTQETPSEWRARRRPEMRPTAAALRATVPTPPPAGRLA